MQAGSVQATLEPVDQALRANCTQALGELGQPLLPAAAASSPEQAALVHLLEAGICSSKVPFPLVCLGA